MNNLLKNYVFSEDDDSDGDLKPRERHYYEIYPKEAKTRYPWYREDCHNCGRRGHTSNHCERLAIEPRCTYCGIAGHKRAVSPKKHQARAINQRDAREIQNVISGGRSERSWDTNSESTRSSIVTFGDDVIIEEIEIVKNVR